MSLGVLAISILQLLVELFKMDGRKTGMLNEGTFIKAGIPYDGFNNDSGL